MKTKQWIPVWDYAQKIDVPVQTIYRWIRERKIPEDKVKREPVTKEKIFIQYEN